MAWVKPWERSPAATRACSSLLGWTEMVGIATMSVEQCIALERLGAFIGCYKMERAATTWQQLPAASESTFHQFGMGDDETRPEAVVFVVEFGLREASRG